VSDRDPALERGHVREAEARPGGARRRCSRSGTRQLCAALPTSDILRLPSAALLMARSMIFRVNPLQGRMSLQYRRNDRPASGSIQFTLVSVATSQALGPKGVSEKFHIALTTPWGIGFRNSARSWREMPPARVQNLPSSPITISVGSRSSRILNPDSSNRPRSTGEVQARRSSRPRPDFNAAGKARTTSSARMTDEPARSVRRIDAYVVSTDALIRMLCISLAWKCGIH
jgi:hypothetical protein